MGKGFMVIFLCSVLTGCVGKLPVVGQDLRGKAFFARINDNQYASELTKNLLSIHDAVIPALESENSTRAWQIYQLRMGVTLKGSLGFGKFKLGGSAGIRMVFDRVEGQS